MLKKNLKEQKEIERIASSGNVYANTDHSNSEEALAKAELAILISSVIKRKKLTQKKAAELIGIDQPKISAIIRGQLSGFTLDRLFRFLMALGMNIIIKVKPYTARSTAPCIQVIQPQSFKEISTSDSQFERTDK
jgi:predicted XRE-type DNA-binding protein